MSAGMAGVIAAHRFEADGFCACQRWNVFEAETTFHAIHVAEELVAAGYGKLAPHGVD